MHPTRFFLLALLLIPLGASGAMGGHCEANGIQGLQQKDNGVDDTCHGMVEPDFLLTLIF